MVTMYPKPATPVSQRKKIITMNTIKRLQNMKYTPHLINRAKEKQTGRPQLNKLAACEPVDPLGWFRFLHDRYLGRFGHEHGEIFMSVYRQGWEKVSNKPENFPDVYDLLWLDVLNRHAWTVGILGLIKPLKIHWKGMTKLARGSFLAGFSEQYPSSKIWKILISKLPHIEFTPETLCQLACNAIKYNRKDALTVLLNTITDLSSPIHRGDGFIYPESRWPEIMDQLSHRLIDLVLEAALIRNNYDAIKLALEHGADPDIPIWCLERSYNEKHCALSFAISKDNREIAELLLQHGANPAGNSFSGRNSPFFQAHQRGAKGPFLQASTQNWYKFADELYTKASLEQKPPKTPTPESAVKSEGTEWEIFLPVPGRFFGYFQEELDWAHRVIGSIIPLVPVDEKESFYHGNVQGGYRRTTLDLVMGKLTKLKEFEVLGMDTRLSAEELCTAVKGNAYDCLVYLLECHGPAKRDQVLSEIARRKPDFGPGPSNSEFCEILSAMENSRKEKL